jgi:hypothetical protein
MVSECLMCHQKNREDENGDNIYVNEKEIKEKRKRKKKQIY